MKTNKTSKLSLCAIALVLALCLSSSASANYDPLGSGQTKLKLDKRFLALMKENGVKLSAVAPAKLKSGTLTLPVSGGKFDPTSAKGTVEHSGELRFKSGAREVRLSAWQLKTTQRGAPFSVKAGGGQLKLAAAKSLKVSRAGFANDVKVTKLTLSAKVATRLAKKLRLREVFKAGLPLGGAKTVANPETITVLAKGRATLTLDPGFEAKLKSLFVAVNPIFPAEHPGAFTLAIFGGTIAPDASQGTLETQGALELLQLGGGQVFWGEAWLDLQSHSFSPELDVEPSPPYAGKLERQGVASLALAPGGVKADPRANTVTVSGASLTASPATAQLLNEVFARPQGKAGVFVAGEVLGSVGFVAVGQ
jgi:hypothetical protein